MNGSKVRLLSDAEIDEMQAAVRRAAAVREGRERLQFVHLPLDDGSFEIACRGGS